MEAVVIRGVSLERNQAKVTVGNVPDQPGFASRVFRAIADAGIIIDMIVQNTSEAGVTDISFTLNKDELAKAKEVLMESVGKLSEDTRVTSEEGVAKVSAVGIGMRSHSGVAADMFTALAAAKINIKMISTSEIKTAVIVAEADVEAAARAVHDGFGLGEKDLLA
ncbi:MAG: ACT domain-containing protein, partial [Verrucomicrobiales bacterium]